MGTADAVSVFCTDGLKFVFPQLVTIPDFVYKKTELTTLTMFYDAYYDFGIIGTALFAFIIGLTAAAVSIPVHPEEKSDDVYVLWTDCDLSGACLFYDLVQ